MAFLAPSPEERESAHTRREEGIPQGGAGLEADVRHFLKSKGGKATKTELYAWAKKRGIPPAALYSAISRLSSEGKIVKRFDEGSGELVYELSKG